MNTEYFVTVDLKSSGQGIFVAGATLSQQQVVATTFMTGPTGKAATIEIASTTTVAPNQPATVTNIGDEHHTILEFEIPKGDPGTPATNPVESVNGKTGIVTLDHTDVGADESGSAATAEANANVYTDAQTAAAILESKGYTDDELQALATAIGAQLAAKANALDLASHVSDTNNPHGVTKAQVGLSNVDNTSDSNKPVSTAQAAADATKVSKAGDTMTGRLSSTASVLSHGQTRASKEILWGVDVDGNWNMYNNTDARPMLTVMQSGQGIALGYVDSSSPRILKGTGFPNGVVSASTGSIYIDTAVTNGASSWIKKSGAGNTGWQVLEGNTGWRRLESYLNTDYFSPTQTDTQYILIRRMGNAVFLRGRLSTTASTTSTSRGVFTASGINALVGFRESAAFTPIVQLTASNGWGAPSTALMRSAIGQGSGSITDAFEAAQFASGLNISVLTSWSTLEPWPTTLPGTAA